MAATSHSATGHIPPSVGGKSRYKTRKCLDRRQHLGELPHRLTTCMPVSREFIPNGSISLTASSHHWPPHRQSQARWHLDIGDFLRTRSEDKPRSSVAPRRLGMCKCQSGVSLLAGVSVKGGMNTRLFKQGTACVDGRGSQTEVTTDTSCLAAGAHRHNDASCVYQVWT